MMETVSNTGWWGGRSISDGRIRLGGPLVLGARLALATLLASSLFLAACSDEGIDPPPPSLDGEWIVTSKANAVVTTLELDQDGNTLTGFWIRNGEAIRVTGRITPSKEFNLTGKANGQTYVFNVEANDGLSRFAGTLSVYDGRGVRTSLQMVTGRR